MSGKIVASLIVLIALAVGAGVYYAQVYGYYERVVLDEIRLTTLDGTVEPIPASDIEAIDAFSSPIRFRACFTTTLTPEELAARYAPYPEAEPLTGPGWFSCYDADAVGADLAEGGLTGWLGVENFTYGIDRVLAIGPDGRGYVWHQINRCGEVVFDGQPAPEGCPPKPED
jgi:hypothetical protein